MTTPSISHNMTCGKLDVGAAPRGYSQHVTSSMVPKGQHDNYGRTGLCKSSLFQLYPGSPDCEMCGLINQETTTRPAYWKYVGGECGSCYTGGSDQMILGFSGGPRGNAYCPAKAALGNVDCSGLSCPAAREMCQMTQMDQQLARKNNYQFSGPLAQN